MKDWKAEYDKLKGVMQEMQRQIDYQRNVIENSQRMDREIRNRFKELLIDVLGQ